MTTKKQQRFSTPYTSNISLAKYWHRSQNPISQYSSPCVNREIKKSKQTYGEHVDKVNYVEMNVMNDVSELAIIGLLLKPFKTWVVPGKPTVILTRTRGGMLEIELVRFMDLLPC